MNRCHAAGIEAESPQGAVKRTEDLQRIARQPPKMKIGLLK